MNTLGKYRNLLQWRSLATRLTVVTLAVFLLGVWSLAFYVSHTLQEDMQRLLGEQQFSTATIVAAEIEREMGARVHALETYADEFVGPLLPGNPAALQTFLERRPVLLELFNGGIVVLTTDGTALVDAPRLAGRSGRNYMNQPDVAAAFKSARTVISRPTMGRVLQAPAIAIIAPIRDAQGKAMGALMGLTNLGQANFLDRIIGNRYGKTGGFLLVAPQHKLIVTATDKRLVMQPTLAAGVDPLVDRFTQGYEGSGVLVNPLSVETFASAKGVPAAGWYLGITLPTAEAFAPIRALQQRMLLAALLLTLLMGALVWWVVRRQLAPMLAAAGTLAGLSDEGGFPTALPVHRKDEIGALIGGFNRLLQTLQLRDATLQATRNHLQATLDAIPDLLFEIGLDGRLHSHHTHRADLLAAPPEVFLGKTIAEVLPAAATEVCMAALREAAEVGWSIGSIYSLSLPAGEHWFELSVAAMPATSDGDPRFVLLSRDITERKRAEAAHASIEAQLRESQKMQAIGTLAGGIAHDFNNIIATILGNAELAREDASVNPPVLQSLDEIRKAASRARDLVQQILSFSRRQPTDKKRIALLPVIEESVRLLRATLPARVVLEVECAPDAPAVLADATQLEQVIINLATNAMQAMRGAPGRISLRLDALALDAALADAHPALRAMRAQHAQHAQFPGVIARLVVSDDGPGMEAAVRERIFEPFFTTKPVNEGTGLGLSVVHGIVQAHEGAITVESEPGKGTSFTLYLRAAEADAALTATAATAARAATPALARRRILYLDDDAALVSLMTRLLARKGYHVSGFVDQREALEALRADPTAFDLVITDYNMPGMSGLDVVREVRTLRADLPVAIASGFIDATLTAQAAQAGVHELIFKATAVDELCATVQRLAQTAGGQS